MKITKAIFNEIDFGRIQVTIELEGKTKETIFSYYKDELSFTERELVGLTINQARALFFQKDIEYMKS